ncbi:hypothetical protein BDB01DRAFT_836912 [Pilobolus umbonatus]|nr:hypothetical protein BDB01DRAFT_836912 [Pilobolus umbonatus]
MNRWKSLKGKLICYNYWSSTSFSEWSLINFYRSLVTIDPTKPRREAIQLLENDLKVLGAAFVDSKESKVIIGLHAALRNQNDALDHFWHTSYPKLQKNAIDHITNVDKVEAGLEEEAVERLQSKKRMNTQPQTKDTKKRQTDKATDKATGEATDVESDGIMIPNSIVSLGTIIKREALKLHQLYLQNPKQLTDRQRKTMTTGLSSILDLSDQSYSSQRELFDNDQWNISITTLTTSSK